jgi:hypothetical protein
MSLSVNINQTIRRRTLQRALPRRDKVPALRWPRAAKSDVNGTSKCGIALCARCHFVTSCMYVFAINIIHTQIGFALQQMLMFKPFGMLIRCVVATPRMRFVAFASSRVGCRTHPCENVFSFQSSEVSGRNFR